MNDIDFLPLGYGMRVEPSYNEPQELEQVNGYEINIDSSEVRCPCCGKLLKPIHKKVKTDEFIGESKKLNERWENEFLTQKVQDVANQLYEEELADVQPETDEYGNVTREYLERFEYSSPQLRKAVKRAATKLSNDLKDDGFNINPWYCEQEIFDALKCFSK